MKLMQNEPVAVFATGVALAEAIILVGQQFYFRWTDEQHAAVMALVIAAGAFLQVVFTRSRVTPTRS